MLVEAAERRAAGQLGGHDRGADLVAGVVKGGIVDAVVPVRFTTGLSGFGDHIVGAKDGIVFMEVGKIVMLGDGGRDAVDGLGNGGVAAGYDLLHFVGGGDLGLGAAPGGLQVEFLLDGFTRGFRQAVGHAVGIDAAAVGADQGADDVDMGVIGVFMAVDEVRLMLHLEPLHIAVGDGGKLLVG